MSLADNKADREAAEDAMRMLDVVDRRPRFWECLAQLAQAKAGGLPPPPPGIEPLDYDEAREFSREKFPAGMHAGMEVIDVPKGYCCWWADQTGHGRFITMLRRYVRSTYFASLPDE